MPNEVQLSHIRTLALQAFDENREPITIELLRTYLSQKPDDAYAWFRYGDALRIVGRSRDALVAFNTAIALAPDRSATIHIQLGKLHHDAGRYAEAERAYAIACDAPENKHLGYVWILRGCNLASSENFPAAESCHRRALTYQENVDRDEAFLNLGNVLAGAQARYTEAAEAYQHALALSPDDPDILTAINSLTGINEAFTPNT